MPKRAPLTLEEKKTIYYGKLQGQTLHELAQHVDCSLACARKWWRIGRDGGLDALRRRRPAERRTGALAHFDPMIRERALFWKRAYPRRGPERLLDEMQRDELLQGLQLPARSSLAAFFKEVCPELLQKRQRRGPKPPKAQQVHECWQLDAKENIRLGDGTICSVLTVREPVACVYLGLFAHETTTEKAWRKLSREELQEDLRTVFSCYGRPKALQTDRERVFGTPAGEQFPTPLSLWLVGLGIEHHFSRPAEPTDQAEVERAHRTWHDWLWQAQPAQDLESYQMELDQARHKHNHVLPSRAGDCQGHPPYSVHPEVDRPYHAYDRGAEPVLFRLRRVDEYLAQHRWSHQVTQAGQVSVGESVYYVGKRHGGHSVTVCFDQADRHVVFLDPPTEQEIKRQPVKKLGASHITGLDMAEGPSARSPCQLSFF